MSVAVRTILQTVAEKRGVDRIEILADRRQKETVEARHEVFYIARKLTRHSLPAIARIVGGRDHTSVLHGARRIERRIEDDPAYASEILAMMDGLRDTPDDEAPAAQRGVALAAALLVRLLPPVLALAEAAASGDGSRTGRGIDRLRVALAEIEEIHLKHKESRA